MKVDKKYLYLGGGIIGLGAIAYFLLSRKKDETPEGKKGCAAGEQEYNGGCIGPRDPNYKITCTGGQVSRYSAVDGVPTWHCEAPPAPGETPNGTAITPNNSTPFKEPTIGTGGGRQDAAAYEQLAPGGDLIDLNDCVKIVQWKAEYRRTMGAEPMGPYHLIKYVLLQGYKVKFSVESYGNVAEFERKVCGNAAYPYMNWGMWPQKNCTGSESGAVFTNAPTQYNTVTSCPAGSTLNTGRDGSKRCADKDGRIVAYIK